jgi:hypothetical protein
MEKAREANYNQLVDDYLTGAFHQPKGPSPPARTPSHPSAGDITRGVDPNAEPHPDSDWVNPTTGCCYHRIAPSPRGGGCGGITRTLVPRLRPTGANRDVEEEPDEEEEEDPAH